MSVKNRKEIILRKSPGQPASTQVMSPRSGISFVINDEITEQPRAGEEDALQLT